MAKATTATVDTNPAFWERWEQLGHAVVAQAVEDYATARKLEEKKQFQDWDLCHYDVRMEMGYYEQFFTSKYFSYICPKYDGHELLNILQRGGWRMVHKIRHYTPKSGVERSVIDTRAGRKGAMKQATGNRE